jgi:hypothetical protein
MTAPNPPAGYETGTDLLLAERAAAIATVTFNNPAKRNALSAEIRAALPGLLTTLQADPDVRVIVLTGAGDKAFVSGADISEFGAQRTAPAARAGFDQSMAAIGRAWAAGCSPRCKPTSGSPPTTASSASRPRGSDSATPSAA